MPTPHFRTGYDQYASTYAWMRVAVMGCSSLAARGRHSRVHFVRAGAADAFPFDSKETMRQRSLTRSG